MASVPKSRPVKPGRSCKSAALPDGCRFTPTYVGHVLCPTYLAWKQPSPLQAGRCIDPANNIAKPGLKWGLRLARACLAPGFAGDVGVEIALVIDVAVDGEPQP